MWRSPETRPTTTRSSRSTSCSAGSSSAGSTRNLRERKGYTYGARTSFDFRRGRGPFALHASVQSDATADAVREALVELRAIRGDRPVTAEELELGRAPLTRGYPRGFETADQIGRAIAQIALYDLPDDYFTTFVPKVLALTPEDLTARPRTHIDPSRFLAVIVGDRDKMGAMDDLGLGEANCGCERVRPPTGG